MSAQHTPGPWFTDPHDATKVLKQFRSPKVRNETIAVTNRTWMTEREKRGNARLIAAAPEMLAALQAVLAEIDGPDRPHSTDSWLPSHLAHQVRVAVANATRPGGWSNA